MKIIFALLIIRANTVYGKVNLPPRRIPQMAYTQCSTVKWSPQTKHIGKFVAILGSVVFNLIGSCGKQSLLYSKSLVYYTVFHNVVA